MGEGLDVSPAQPPGQWRVVALATLLSGAAVAAGWWIHTQGESLGTPTDVGAGLPAGSPPIDPVLQLLVALALIIGLARLLGVTFAHFGQPAVMGEVVGGLLLGPSFLGHVAPGVARWLLPDAVAPSINIIAQLGVILYMFLVGLEFDPGLLRRRAAVALAISYASIAVPFLLGLGLAERLYSTMARPEVPFTSFALFLGVALSITAFPVLARILTDLHVSCTPLGNLALACAAVNDVVAWCLLAFAVSMAKADLTSAVVTMLLTLGYVALMLLVVRPVFRFLVPVLEARGHLGDGGLALMAVSILLAALGTEIIGIHALFGAFLFGALMPHESQVARDLRGRLQDVVRVLFLPAFFAYTGLRTQLGLLGAGDEWLLCALIILAASAGKVGGTVGGARMVGLAWRDAAALGVLMNTRGLVELIALNVGLDLRIISPTLFAMLVLMALVTTLTTTPAFCWITRGQPRDKGTEESPDTRILEIG